MTAEHGTNTQYNRGCSCSDCRYAHASHQRQYMRELRRLAELGRAVERAVKGAE